MFSVLHVYCEYIEETTFHNVSDITTIARLRRRIKFYIQTQNQISILKRNVSIFISTQDNFRIHWINHRDRELNSNIHFTLYDAIILKYWISISVRHVISDPLSRDDNKCQLLKNIQLLKDHKRSCTRI